VEALHPFFWTIAVRGWFVSFRLMYRFLRELHVCGVGHALESALGFRHSHFHVPGDKTSPYSKVLIKSVELGGEFEKAGFRSGDILPEMAGVNLSRFLAAHRGESVEFAAINITEVADGDRPFEELPRRVLTIAVPQ